ncbi:FAD/NAD(P)-binding domain-containing protein [Aureobasidium pullulans]|nr:FAD/NAD(P)-binding domain-containing protein [Aureobasidium pullulans]
MNYHQTSTMTQKPILISGAGLASLLLARSLLRYKIPFRVFERDASLSSRGQGYRLRLSSEGLDAIESALEPAAWQKFYDRCGKTGGGGMKTIDATTGEAIEQPPAAPAGNSSSGESGGSGNKESLSSREGKVVGIARGDMRSLFMEGCEQFVQFNKHVKGYELTTDGVKAIFSDGTKSEEGSMLIGGEGINSYIAKQLSNGKLKVYDTGARGIHGQAPTTAFKGLGEGVFRIVDNSRPNGSFAVITNVRAGDMDDPNTQFGWTMVGEPGVIKAPNDDYTIVGETASNIARELTKDWHHSLKPLFTESITSEGAFWKITISTPSGVPVWPNQPRVTVIGDAAHSMTPAGGLGANTAVRDSALLGRLLKGGYYEGATADYEKEMRVYGSEAVGKSYGMASKMFKIHIDEDNSTTMNGEVRDNRSSA